MELFGVETTDLLCRTCLCFVDDDDCISIVKDMQLLDMYTACTSLKIYPGDEYPKNICGSCYQQLQMLSDFRKMCSDTLVRFKDFLKTNTTDILKKGNATLIEKEKSEGNEVINNIDSNNKEHSFENLNEHFGKKNYYTDLSQTNDMNKNMQNRNEMFNEMCFTKQHLLLINEIDLNNISAAQDISAKYTGNKFPQIEKHFSDLLTKVTQQQQQENKEIIVDDNIGLLQGLENIILVENEKDAPSNMDTENSPLQNVISSSVADNNSENQKHTIRMYHCEFCSKKFRKNARLQAHLQVHQDLSCPQCDKQFARISSLRTHVQQHHRKESPNISHTCTYDGCRRVFTLHKTLLQHIDESHCENECTKNHMCEMCGKRFSRKIFLNRHRFVHMDVEEFSFECDECGKRFSKKLNLQYHLNRHAGIKNFVCTFCGMQKTTKAELATHLNYHTLEKTWTCAQCEKIFNTLGNLRMHTRTVHDGARDYGCRYCPRRFGKAGTRKYHEMRHTGEKPHLCKLCGRGFIQAVALRSHMKVHAKSD